MNLDSRDIAFTNLQAEVLVLREIVRMLVEETMPFDPSTSQAIRGAVDRARGRFAPSSPERIAVDHACNTMQTIQWMGKRR